MSNLMELLHRLHTTAGFSDTAGQYSATSAAMKEAPEHGCTRSPHDRSARTDQPERSLVAWASDLAEQELVLTAPIRFIEEPLRAITTERVSAYARDYLRLIVSARIHLEAGPDGSMFGPDWWDRQHQRAFNALAALRSALEAQS